MLLSWTFSQTRLLSGDLLPHGSMQQNACGAYAVAAVVAPTSLVLILKPPDPPSSAAGQLSAVPRPLNLPEIFHRLTARAAVRVESFAVGAAMEPLQLGVGVSSGYQIGPAVCFERAKSGVGLRLE